MHQSERFDAYGEPFSVGDVIGCAIFLVPPQTGQNTMPFSVGGAVVPSNTPPSAVSASAPPELAHLPNANHVRFYKNGVDQGVAFVNIHQRCYYPAVSLYGGARVRANFGPMWLVPPPGVITASSTASSTPRGGIRSGSVQAELSMPTSTPEHHQHDPLHPTPTEGGTGVPFMRSLLELRPPLSKVEMAEQAKVVRMASF